MKSDLLRFVIATLPLLILFITIQVRKHDKRILAGVFLTLLWNFSVLYIINMVALAMGWWFFVTEDPFWLKLPPDIIFGWAVFWGPLFYLSGRKLPIIVLFILAFWLDLILMPAAESLVILGDNWLIGEAAVLCLAFLPGLWLARATEHDQHVVVRGAMQAGITGMLGFFILPAGILEITGISWSKILDEPTLVQSFYFNLILPALIIGLSANFEFSRNGNGTPIPFDPPKKIVATGIYAYLANPMQVYLVWTYVCMALYFKSLTLLGIAAMSMIYSVGFVSWYNKRNIQQQWSDEWEEYKLWGCPR